MLYKIVLPKVTVKKIMSLKRGQGLNSILVPVLRALCKVVESTLLRNSGQQRSDARGLCLRVYAARASTMNHWGFPFSSDIANKWLATEYGCILPNLFIFTTDWRWQSGQWNVALINIRLHNWCYATRTKENTWNQDFWKFSVWGFFQFTVVCNSKPYFVNVCFVKVIPLIRSLYYVCDLCWSLNLRSGSQHSYCVPLLLLSMRIRAFKRGLWKQYLPPLRS